MGEVYWKQSELTQMVSTLHRRGWQIAAHTAGDGGHDLILHAIDSAIGGVPVSPLRPRIEHAMVLRDDQIKRMRQLGVLASVQLTWLTSDWLLNDETANVEATLGAHRIGWAARWRDLLDARNRGGADHGGREGAVLRARRLDPVPLSLSREHRPAFDLFTLIGRVGSDEEGRRCSPSANTS